jgi:hypothetical protein
MCLGLVLLDLILFILYRLTHTPANTYTFISPFLFFLSYTHALSTHTHTHTLTQTHKHTNTHMHTNTHTHFKTQFKDTNIHFPHTFANTIFKHAQLHTLFTHTHREREREREEKFTPPPSNTLYLH